MLGLTQLGHHAGRVGNRPRHNLANCFLPLGDGIDAVFYKTIFIEHGLNLLRTCRVAFSRSRRPRGNQSYAVEPMQLILPTGNSFRPSGMATLIDSCCAEMFFARARISASSSLPTPFPWPVA